MNISFISKMYWSKQKIVSPIRLKRVKKRQEYWRAASLFYIERYWHLTRNLDRILPLMSKLSGKFHRFSAINGSIEMLKNGLISKIQSKWNFKLFCEAQTMSYLKEITQISLPHQKKASNISGTKSLIQKFTRTYKHLLSEGLENPVRRHLEMVQWNVSFWHQPEIRLLENLESG